MLRPQGAAMLRRGLMEVKTLSLELAGATPTRGIPSQHSAPPVARRGENAHYFLWKGRESYFVPVSLTAATVTDPVATTLEYVILPCHSASTDVGANVGMNVAE